MKDKDKVLNVIASCRNLEHIDVARNYVRLYRKMYPDTPSFGILLMLQIKEDRLTTLGGDGIIEPGVRIKNSGNN